MNGQAGSEKSWRVLVVDDLPVWGESVSSFAMLFNCEVRLATNLSAAVRELARWRPHLIILDLHMPRDEWEPIPEFQNKYKPNQKTLAFCEQITSHPQLSDILVAIVSVEKQMELQRLASIAGAHYFYNKGDFNAEKFEFLLNQLTDLHRVME